MEKKRRGLWRWSVTLGLAGALSLGAWFWGRTVGRAYDANRTAAAPVNLPVVGTSRAGHDDGPHAPPGGVSKSEPRVEQPSASPPLEMHPLARVPADKYHSRAADEWQGMLVNMAQPQTCETSGHCGDALACRDGQCGPCAHDTECQQGESCVLDHCVLSGSVECRSRRDCGHLGPEALCILSGLTGGDPRANVDMRAICSSGVGGTNDSESSEVASATAREVFAPSGPVIHDAEMAHALWSEDSFKVLAQKVAGAEP